MGDSHALPGFGELDLGLSDSEPSLDKDAVRVEEETAPPPSTSRVFGPRPTKRTPEATRIMPGDMLASMTTNTRPAAATDDGLTHAWIEVTDEASQSSAAPSSSGVASGDGRVAAMRELYAKGDAEGALALAATFGDQLPNGVFGDHPDASIVVEFDEVGVEIDIDLGPSVDSASALTWVPPARPSGEMHRPSRPPVGSIPPQVITVAPGTPQLSLTERQSIPRILKADISKLPLDHRAGFLLAHVDGMQTLEEILDVCAMPATEALDVIAKLKGLGVIDFE